MPIVAVAPMRGWANVIEKTTVNPITPPSHIHAGDLNAPPIPPKPVRATSRIVSDSASCTPVANVSASTMPMRPPKRPITATWIDPARPARTASATAADVKVLLRGVGIVLPEAEGVALGVLAAREPAVCRYRLLVAGGAAELAHLRCRGFDVVGREIDDRAGAGGVRRREDGDALALGRSAPCGSRSPPSPRRRGPSRTVRSRTTRRDRRRSTAAPRVRQNQPWLVSSPLRARKGWP